MAESTLSRETKHCTCHSRAYSRTRKSCRCSVRHRSLHPNWHSHSRDLGAHNHQPYNPHPNQAGHVSSKVDPVSPQSTRSPISHASEITGSTAALERYRHFSPPLVVTPTNSTCSISFPRDSHDEFQQLALIQHTHFIRYNHTSDPRNIPLSPSIASSTLAGIEADQCLPPTDHFLRQNVEFISDRGPSPGSQQRYPHIPEPWTGHPFRHEDKMLADPEPNRPVFGISYGPQTPILSPAEGSERASGGKRIGPLSTEQRKNAYDVRQLGACLRCSYMKETCDNGDPCGNCQNKRARKWKAGCRRRHLEHHMEYLLPDILTSKLQPAAVNKFMYNHAYWYFCDAPPFKVRLDLELGRPLELLVKEVEPVDAEQLKLKGFLNVNKAGQRINGRIDICSPPIMLYLEDKQLGCHRIRQQIRVWAEQVLTDRDEDREWPSRWPCVLSEQSDDGSGWLGDMLQLVHDYCRPTIEEHKILFTALHILFFDYILTHQCEVLPEDVPGLYQTLRNPSYQNFIPKDPVCPSTINRFIKMLVLPLLTEVVRMSTTDLHALLHTCAHSKTVATSKRDLAFCIAFILLVFIGKVQKSVLQKGQMAEDEASDSFGIEPARKLIRDIESQLAEYVIHFHAYGYGRRKSTGGSTWNWGADSDSYAAKFQLMERVRTLYEGRGDMEVQDTDLGEIDSDSFGVTNTDRLCWKFVKAMMDN